MNNYQVGDKVVFASKITRYGTLLTETGDNITPHHYDRGAIAPGSRGTLIKKARSPASWIVTWEVSGESVTVETSGRYLEPVSALEILAECAE